MTASTRADHLLARTARNQRGAFTRQQAVAAGIATSTVDRRVRTGRWRRLQPGVYAESATPDGWWMRAAAVLLALGGEAALCRSSAARVHGLSLGARDGHDAIHVLLHSRRPRGLSGVVAHRTESMKDHHVTTVRGLRVTTVARTLVDTSNGLRPTQVRGAITDALRRELTTRRGIEQVVAEVGRLRGIRAVKDVLAELSPLAANTASELESRWLTLVTRAGLAPTAVNHPVTDASGRTRYLDAVYLPEGIVIELDGAAFHTLPTDRNDDRLRANDLALAGFPVVLRFTWWDVTERPGYVVDTVRRALAAASTG